MKKITFSQWVAKDLQRKVFGSWSINSGLKQSIKQKHILYKNTYSIKQKKTKLFTNYIKTN